MILLRPAAERGRTRFEWLDSRHTFSFGDYHDARHMGFRSLRVINDDIVEPGTGFGTHPHRDMEILTLVLDGALEHKDSTGAAGVIRPGDIQRMSAGTGIRHSEYNHSKTEPVHFLQIWIIPEARGLKPGYAQVHIPADERRGRLRLLASRDGRDGSVTINQDATVHTARLQPGEKVEHALARGRGAWVHVASGAVRIGDRPLGQGDGAVIEDEPRLVVTGSAAASAGGAAAGAASDADPAEILIFDLA
jgi:hypothetical protein